MPYSRGTCTYNDIYSDRPIFGPFDINSEETFLNDNLDYNSEYNKEANQLLNETKEEFILNNLEISAEKFDFSYDICHAKLIPYWYQEMLQSKIKETKRRLKSLSNVVSNICTSTGAQIKGIEHDHNVTFCKMDCPRYPALNKPWTNTWKFDCTVKCKETDKPNHTHTDNCESHILLEHSDTRVSTATTTIFPMEYPEYVMDALKLFQDFARESTGNVPLSDSVNPLNTLYAKFMWTEIDLTLRSNYLNQIMLVVRGKNVSLLIPKLKKYFESGPGRNSNVISVLCIDQNRSKNKRNKPIKLTSISELNDQVGSILVQYDAKTDNSFNSVEIIQLEKLIDDYAGLTEESTLLDISCCNFGILSLMISHKCEKVIGLIMGQPIHLKISHSEKLRVLNNIHNVTFIDCNPSNVLTKCSPLIEQCKTVAVLNLSSPYGKSRQVMQALRDIASIGRIIVYGSFTNDFHGYISILTSKNDSLEECYLPVRSCILDKLPTAKSAFDIAILFERQSLVTPKLEPPSPTLDIKPDLETYNYDFMDMQENFLQQENIFQQGNLFQQENLQQPRDEQLLSYLYLHNCLTPPREKYPSPPLPPPPSPPPPPPPLPMDSNLLHTSHIKIENEEFYNCANSTLPVTTKSEPVDFYESFSKALNDNNVLLDMEISPNPQDPDEMKTPIHKLKSINNAIYSPPPPVFTKVILDGFQFTVQANKSYLNLKHGPKQSNANTNINEGKSDYEVKIIGKKKSEQREKLKPRIRVKTVDEIMKMKSVPENNDDLYILYEKRKEILEQLKEEKETECYKDSHGHLLLSDLPRTLRRQSSSSTSRSSRKHNYTLSPCKHRSSSNKRRRKVP